MTLRTFVAPGPRGRRRAPARDRSSGLRPPPPEGVIATYARALDAVLRPAVEAVDAILRRHGLLPTRTDAAADGDGPRPNPEDVRRAERELAELRATLANRVASHAVLDVVAARVATHSARQWSAALAKLGVKLLDGREPHINHLHSLWQHRNLDLITSLSAEHVDRVRQVLEEHRGARVEEIAERIQGATGASEAQASLIARDQVLKLNAQITQARHQAAGITEYVWRTSRDERVRPRHKHLDGTRQRYSAPPVVDPRTGRRGHPGEDYPCRCTADPVIPGATS